MRTSTVLISIAVASAATLLTAPAQAAPASVPAFTSGQTSSVEKADYRKCWWSDGRRHCRWVESSGPRYRSYGYGVGEGRPEDYRIGSTEWWRAMDREDRGGFRR